MAEHVYFVTVAVIFGTILAVFGMRYYASVQQAKAKLDQGDAYRQTAEQTAAALASIQASMADAKTRLAAIEKILKDVG